MKKKLFLGTALFALIAVLSGCSNVFDNYEDSKSKTSDMPVQISISKKSGRYIAATEWALSDISSWTLSFTEKNTNAKEIGYWDSTTTEHTDATITVEYNKDTKIFGLSKIGTGTYTLEITGSKADSYSVYGTTSIVIDSEKTNSATVLLDLKRQSTGNLSLTFSAGASNLTISDSLANTITATLTPLEGSNGTEKSFTLSTDNTADFYISSEKIILSLTSFPSGFYKLTFDNSDDLKTKYYVTSNYQIIEIADGVSTTKDDLLLYCLEKKIFYATNSSDSASKNGLSSSTPKGVNALLENLSESLEENYAIDIYMNSIAPSLDVSSVEKLSEKLSSLTSQAVVSIYQASSTNLPSFMIENSIEETGTLIKSYIQSDVTITNSASEAKTLSVTGIKNQTSDNDFTDINLSLVGNVSVSADSVAMDTHTLYITADDLSAYSTTPLLTINSVIDSTVENTIQVKSDSYKARFDTDSTANTTKVYAQLVGSGNVSIASFSANASLKANYESVTDTVYSTAAVIPYKTDSDNLVFTLDGVDATISAYSWLLNGNSVGSEKTLSFVPSESNYLNLDETNTVSLHVQINDSWYYTEFTFTFSSTDYSRAVYITTDSYNNPNGIYEADYANASSGTSLNLNVSDSSPAFTFDNSQNLWIVKKTSSDSSYYLQLIKQSKVISSSSFKNTTLQCNLTGITFTNLNDLDITYDTKNKLIYVLATESTTTDNTTTYTSKIYAFNPANLTDSTTTANSTVTIDTSTWTDVLSTAGITSVKFTKIAVNDTTAYLADSAYNVFKVTNLTTKPSPSYVDNLATKLNITEGTDYLTLTDMQIGDGFGNDTDNLYVLMRQHTITYDGIQPNSGSTYYSRGALCKIDSSNTVTSYGFSTTSTVDTINTNKTQTFYTPGETPTSVEFYGPRYFAAICPKKLVIADDGFYYTNTGDNGSLTNKDGFLEFDINATENQLSRTSAEVEISIPNSTAYTKTNYN